MVCERSLRSESNPILTSNYMMKERKGWRGRARGRAREREKESETLHLVTSLGLKMSVDMLPRQTHSPPTPKPCD